VNAQPRILLILLPMLASPCAPAAAQTNNPAWPMFHHDALHTGFAPGIGKFPTNEPPRLLWKMPAFAPATSTNTASFYRFYSGFPLVDLDGQPGLEVVATGPDATAAIDGLTNGRVVAIHTDRNGTASYLWPPRSYAITSNWGNSDWLDQYSSAVVTCGDTNRCPQIVFSSKRGVIRAIHGRTGEPLWEYDTGRFIEAGPMVADLDRDGTEEVIVATGDPSLRTCTNATAPGVLIFSSVASGWNPPVRVVPFPVKIDSEEPAIVDLNPPGRNNSKTMILGTWSGVIGTCPPGVEIPSGLLVAVWFDLATGSLTNAVCYTNTIAMTTIAALTSNAPPASLPDDARRPVVRSSPLLWNFGDVWIAFFNWMWS